MKLDGGHVVWIVGQRGMSMFWDFGSVYQKRRGAPSLQLLRQQRDLSFRFITSVLLAVFCVLMPHVPNCPSALVYSLQKTVVAESPGAAVAATGGPLRLLQAVQVLLGVQCVLRDVFCFLLRCQYTLPLISTRMF